MTIKMPSISAKLDQIRLQARLLHSQGFREFAIELMRISRGEVKIEAGSELFGLKSSDIQKAKTCTLLQRKIIAANFVESEKYGTSEDDYANALGKISKGNKRWPKNKPRKIFIQSVAQKYGLSESSLTRFMKKNHDWKYSNPYKRPYFQHPDWHPDNAKLLFKKGEKKPEIITHA